MARAREAAVRAEVRVAEAGEVTTAVVEVAAGGAGGVARAVVKVAWDKEEGGRLSIRRRGIAEHTV